VLNCKEKLHTHVCRDILLLTDSYIWYIRWQDKRPNTEVLQICNISGIEALLIAAQFRWTGHVIRMSNDRLPKIIFCSELKDGARARGGQRKRYKDTLKANLKRCSIVPADLETLVIERSKWRSLCKTSIQQFESDRIRALEAKTEQRKTATIRSAACYPCQICGQTCASRIGLYSHSRMHQHWLRSGIRRVDGPVQQPTIISQHL